MKYTTVYFDLDNTLLDFSAAQSKAINNLLLLHGITPLPEYIDIYSTINNKFWSMFERGEIKREDIFTNRFSEFVSVIGANADATKMSDDYFLLLAEGHDILEGAKDVLEYVKDKGYTVCATTNGISKTQHKRLRESGIEKFFDYVFVSEDTGRKKPEKEFFDYVIENTPEKDRKKILIVGDSQNSDILGGINAGIDTCWLNSRGDKAKYTPNFEIRNILELTGIL